VLESYDPDVYAAAGAYDRPRLETALEEFARERVLSLSLLRTIAPEEMARTGVHSALGPVTLGNLLHEWPFHDFGHLRQISELVRALKFYPHMGAWQKFYTIAP
jgi:hypothetical protein